MVRSTIADPKSPDEVIPTRRTCRGIKSEEASASLPLAIAHLSSSRPLLSPPRFSNGSLILSILSHFSVRPRGTKILPKKGAHLLVGKPFIQMDIQILEENILVWQKVIIFGPNFQHLLPEVEATNFLAIDDAFYESEPNPEPKTAPTTVPRQSSARSSAPNTNPSSSCDRSRSPSGGLALLLSCFYGSFLRSSKLQRRELRYKAKKRQEKYGIEPDFTLLDEASDYDADATAHFFDGQASDYGFDGGHDGSSGGVCLVSLSIIYFFL